MPSEPAMPSKPKRAANTPSTGFAWPMAATIHESLLNRLMAEKPGQAVFHSVMIMTPATVRAAPANCSQPIGSASTR